MTWQPEDFDDLGEELRRRVAAEFRNEAEEVERLVQLQRRRRATLGDVAKAAMHQGQGVTIRGFGGEWSGEVLAVGRDYLTLRTPTQHLDVRLDVIAIGLTPARQGGRTGKPASDTFKARLSEFEQTGEEVTLRCSLPDLEVTGIISVVSTDHVEVRLPNDRCYLPVKGVSLAIRHRSE